MTHLIHGDPDEIVLAGRDSVGRIEIEGKVAREGDAGVDLGVERRVARAHKRLVVCVRQADVTADRRAVRGRGASPAVGDSRLGQRVRIGADGHVDAAVPIDGRQMAVGDSIERRLARRRQSPLVAGDCHWGCQSGACGSKDARSEMIKSNLEVHDRIVGEHALPIFRGDRKTLGGGGSCHAPDVDKIDAERARWRNDSLPKRPATNGSLARDNFFIGRHSRASIQCKQHVTGGFRRQDDFPR
jgi:hypothetical protein